MRLIVEFIFMIIGGVSIAELMAITMKKDFLFFPARNGKLNRAEYDVEKVYHAEKLLLFVDGACGIIIALGIFIPAMEWGAGVVFLLTLLGHYHVITGKKFKKQK